VQLCAPGVEQDHATKQQIFDQNTNPYNKTILPAVEQVQRMTSASFNISSLAFSIKDLYSLYFFKVQNS